MRTTVLLAEFLIVGFLGCATILLLTMGVLGVTTVPDSLALPEVLAPVAILVTLVAYLVGAVSFRAMDLFTFHKLPYLGRLPVIRRAFPPVGDRDRDQWITDYHTVLQCGSDHLVHRAEIESSLIRLFKASAFWLLLLSPACLFWLRLVAPLPQAIFLSVLIFLFAIATLFAFAFQREHDRLLIVGGAQLLRRMSLAPAEVQRDDTST